jgi:NADPH2:quinone reductase
MKVIRIHETGGSEVLKLEDLLTPEPREQQVLVKVEAAGVNFTDVYHRTGLYKLPLPTALGVEAAGTVEAIGQGVQHVRVGDRVAWSGALGSYATHALVPSGQLVVIPEAISFQQAAASMVQGMTAHYLTHSTFPLMPGQTCLVHAAAGGVGLLLCQIAKLRGGRVIGTVGTEAKAKLAREAGADEVIIYTQRDFEPEVKRITAGKGVQVVYDSVGKDTFDRGLNCLTPRGYLVLYGQSSGPVAPIDPQVLNARGSLFLTRPHLSHYVATRDELEWRASDVFNWISSGKLRIRIDREYPLAEAAAAQDALTSRQTTGKVLLKP